MTVSLLAHRSQLRLRGVALRYVQPEAECELTGLRSPNPVVLVSPEGFDLTGELWDWIVAAQDLVIAGARVLPREGDELVAADGRWRVLPLTAGEVWRYSDDAASILRIHTRRVSL